MVYRGIIKREDLYNPKKVKLYIPFKNAVQEIRKNYSVIINVHSYGYFYNGGDPKNINNYSLTKESELIVNAVAEIINNELPYLLKYKKPIIIHEGNTIFIEDAIAGVELIYQELEKRTLLNLSEYLLIKDNKSKDTLDEIRFVMEVANKYYPGKIISIAFPNHMLAIERLWKIYSLVHKFAGNYVPEFRITPINEIFEYYNKNNLSKICNTPTMKAREVIELADYYSLGMLRILLHPKFIQKHIKRSVKAYKYDRS